MEKVTTSCVPKAVIYVSRPVLEAIKRMLSTVFGVDTVFAL